MNFYDDLNRYAENIAIITEDDIKITYDELVKTADVMVTEISPRSLVFLVCENTFESVAAYLGFLRKRIVPILINSEIDHDLFIELLNTYRPNYVSSPISWYQNGQEIYSNGAYQISKWCSEYSYIYDDLALMLTTSGSTGSPKLVRLSYGNITSNANSIAQYLGISSEDRPITTMPMSYTYGLSIINSHLLMGASIIMTEATLMQKKFWELLKSHNATTFGGVPYIYEMLKKLRFERMALPSLRILTQAGGRLGNELSAEYADICKKKNIKFIVMYGQTEATARMTYLPYEYAHSKAGSIGIAIPGGKLSLFDGGGNIITDSEVAGELIYEGANVSLGYAVCLDDLTKGDENNAILHTGDMAKRDRDGFYYIVGRKKRFLKIYGNRVNLDEVEGLMKKNGFECACGGTDDHLKIFLTDQNNLNKAKSYISQLTGLNAAAFTTIYVAEIPRNEAGKILYQKLEELYG